MRILQPGLIGITLLAASLCVSADEALKEKFNQKYRDFLAESSQALLPLPEMSKDAWQKLRQTSDLKPVFIDPNRFYNNKTYDFTLYKAGDQEIYYLDVKGGFWGMDELIYGPLQPAQIQ